MDKLRNGAHDFSSNMYNLVIVFEYGNIPTLKNVKKLSDLYLDAMSHLTLCMVYFQGYGTLRLGQNRLLSVVPGEKRPDIYTYRSNVNIKIGKL